MDSKHTPSISKDVPRLLLKYAIELGVDVTDIDPLIDAEGPGSSSLVDRLPIEKFDTLWQTITDRVNDPFFGLHFGEAAASSWNGHILFAVMVNCATLEAALEKFCRYHGLLVTNAAPQLRQAGVDRIFTLEPMALLGPAYAEAILAMFSVTVRRLTENRAQPQEVRFVHSLPVDVSEYQRVFAAPLSFGQPGYGAVLKRRALDTPIFLADPALLAYLEQFAQRTLARLAAAGSWASRVSETMGRLFLQGEKPQLSTLAGMLAISSRQLQNKLQAEGTTYQELLDTVRRQMAQDYLQQGDVTICDVAFLLGFSEQSAFNRAFKAWTGMTPLEFSKGV